jgi:hypothetical protein
VSWVKIALGVLLLLVAFRQFRSPRPAWAPPCPPSTPRTCCWPSAAAPRIAQTGIPGGQQAIAYLVFALIGTLGIGIPVGIYFAMGARSEKLLTGLKDWMSQHSAAIMTVLCLVIAAKLIGDGITSLAG